MKPTKALPLGKKTFPKIPHLPGSRTGSSDRMAPPELARRCVERSTKGDVVIVPAGSAHMYSKVNGEITYLEVRFVAPK